MVTGDAFKFEGGLFRHGPESNHPEHHRIVAASFSQAYFYFFFTANIFIFLLVCCKIAFLGVYLLTDIEFWMCWMVYKWY